MFIDAVSKNGTFLLNFPLLPDGTLDAKEEGILEEITRWIAINGDAIYFTRPWKKFGESPTALPAGSSKDGKLHTFLSGMAGRRREHCVSWAGRGIMEQQDRAHTAARLGGKAYVGG